MDLWIMIGIVIFVMIAQGLLWSWVFIRRRQVIPDVPIFNWRELMTTMQGWIEARRSR